jgi:hypothetical protein
MLSLFAHQKKWIVIRYFMSNEAQFQLELKLGKKFKLWGRFFTQI